MTAKKKKARAPASITEIAALLRKVALAQEAFWDALAELEQAACIEFDGTDNLIDYFNADEADTQALLAVVKQRSGQ